MKLFVEGHPDLKKDSETKAVTSHDSLGYFQRKDFRNKRKQEEQERIHLQEEISELKEQVGQLNSMMQQVLSQIKREQ
jgi:NADH:ubiquinone oxidoreductase subunit C